MTLRSLVAAFALTAVTACSGIAVPADKKDYVGKWEGPGVTLVITADGGVHYVNVSGGGKKELNAPLRAFHGDNFEVGALGLSTTFEVSEPPHLVYGDAVPGEDYIPGIWTMVVDGHTLTRVPGSW